MEHFLFQLPSSVHWEFCRVMDGLSDLDWTRFASDVLKDQTAVRLAERQVKRTDWVMNQWESRNGRVAELIDLLESLQLLRPRDIILSWLQRMNPSPATAAPLPPPPPYEQPTDTHSAIEGGSVLPGPAPPPVSLYSGDHLQSQETHCGSFTSPHHTAACSSTSIICWAYEEVHAGTKEFSPSLQVGEGGFGVVYRASLRGMDCAVKRLRQVCAMDLSQLRKSFQTEVEKLSKFRHPNIVDLLGFSQGGGAMCLIYSYMSNQSLEYQLHQVSDVLSWSRRINIVRGAASALQFLHCPPTGQEPLIHGDVKSSNILLDQHWVAKLSDFGLARCAPLAASGCSASQTASVGKTATVRGTLAYLPDEYVRRGELCTAVDVYSFGVVLLEVLTGRRALEQDTKSGHRFLKDLVEEVEDNPNCLTAEEWRKHLDQRLLSGAAADPDEFLQVAALALRSLTRQRRKRPAMTEVFNKLQDIHNIMKKTSSYPRPQYYVDPSVKLSCSSSCGAFTPPYQLLSSSSPLPPTSLVGPCETDESQGYSQYDHPQSGFRTSCRPRESQCNQPSVPTEDQYFPSQPSSTSDGSGPNAVGAGLSGFSPAGSLQSSSPRSSVCMNPSTQQPLENMSQCEQGQTRTPKLLSVQDSYGETISEALRRPEESDELDHLQSRPT